MKRFLAFIIACAFALPLASAFASPVYASDANDDRVLKVYNWGEYISNGDDDTLDIIQEFIDRTGINTEYTTYATNEEMYAKIASGSAEYDVLIPSDYMIGKLIAEDRLAKLDFNNIPNYSKIDDTFKNLEFDPNNEYSVPYTWGTVGIIYNTTKVDEEITSWEILWDDKYSGQILMFNNPRDAFGIALKKLGYSQNSTDRTELDNAKQELIRQKSVVQAYVMDDIFPKMTNGEAALAPYYAGDALTMIDDNPDLSFAIPDEGTNTFVDSMVVLKNSKNKDLAEQFINFMLEDDIAKANIEFIGYSTPMSSVRDLLDDELKNSPIAYPSTELLAKCDTFSNLDDETNTYLLDSWTDVLSSGSDGAKDTIVLVVIAAIIIVAAVAFIIIKKKRDSKY